ncbi:MAG TPA: DNA gyrase inhibitor YacG [Anaerohalosphaeraceae bacterium]|nr:DNA gyrase inhibitor YacG [Anaerohalosphaeraceae bacterium]HOL89732.1 DNA gyrase inhibitor YacG [Anaerohalosphaeraceae bacterium]HOQ05184.1 DNA gyrase inhibitor YacG [Anaerohalosphaeraceae bacterium]HPP57069.1 DNA gyrase inhibitor YacG [Anaerohalosphaeraceae bacterium]
MKKRNCPICGKETFFQQGSERNPFFPFCSQRCRWVDLGHWLDGAYRIPAEESPSKEESESEKEGSEAE